MPLAFKWNLPVGMAVILGGGNNVPKIKKAENSLDLIGTGGYPVLGIFHINNEVSAFTRFQ
jgi:hypothetical protein